MTYPGGKAGGGVYQAIINQMPPHDVYIEPFLGSGAVMLRKRPARRNIGIDLDPSITFDKATTDALLASAAPGDEFQFHHGDAIAWLEERKRWTGRELVYADPPYLARSRRNTSRAYYRFEMGEDEEHRRLLAVLKRLPCMVMISGYASMLYIAELGDWRLVDFTAMTRRGPATEQLWCNFAAPQMLHDCRYLGDDFRERARIKKMALRWRARFAALEALERQAVLSVCFGEPAG